MEKGNPPIVTLAYFNLLAALGATETNRDLPVLVRHACDDPRSFHGFGVAGKLSAN